MLIDWFTVVAQIINFLILLGLLHRFLYRPILKTIDKRQDQMAARWHAAEEEKAAAKAEAQKHQAAQRELDEHRDRLLADAITKADDIYHEELRQLRDDIAQKRREWQVALENEQQAILADLQQQFGQKMVDIVRRVLQDLANTNLEQQTIQTFQHKLQHLDDETRRAMANAFAHHPVTVQTGLDLPQPIRDALRQALVEANVLNGQAVQFDIAPDLIFGIRLQNEAYELAWSAEDYLQDLEQTLRQTPTQARGKTPQDNGQP
jgi:F-type H+-transporting ATPase subunit b